MIELGEIMRQRDDSAFAELLCRVRTASCMSEDWCCSVPPIPITVYTVLAYYVHLSDILCAHNLQQV